MSRTAPPSARTTAFSPLRNKRNRSSSIQKGGHPPDWAGRSLLFSKTTRHVAGRDIRYSMVPAWFCYTACCVIPDGSGTPRRRRPSLYKRGKTLFSAHCPRLIRYPRPLCVSPSRFYVLSSLWTKRGNAPAFLAFFPRGRYNRDTAHGGGNCIPTYYIGGLACFPAAPLERHGRPWRKKNTAPLKYRKKR